MNNVYLKLTLWDVDASDWRYKSENRIFKNVLNNVEGGDIILMHNISKEIRSVLKKL